MSAEEQRSEPNLPRGSMRLRMLQGTVHLDPTPHPSLRNDLLTRVAGSHSPILPSLLAFRPR
jgi:hypothetical protein